MNTAGFEWFGPPERNTLRPLCVVLPKTEELELSPACVCVCAGEPFLCSERLPFISQGGAYMATGSPTGGPNDVVYNNVLFIHYGVTDEGDLSPGFPCLLLESPVQPVQALSCRNGAWRSLRRCLPRS